MANNSIVFEIEIDNEGVVSGFSKLESQAKKTGDKVGKDIGDGFVGGIRESINKINPLVIAAGAAISGALFGKAAIAASIRQEDAINSLNASLQRIGQFSKQTSQDLQDYASQLQSVTVFGDEAIIEQLAFAQALGATAEQSKIVVKAATDLSAATGQDLNSSVRNITKTLGGLTGELGEVIPQLKELSREQLKNGAGIDLIAQKYKDLAQSQIRTFSGATTQAANSFGDLLETFGSFITQSPAVIGLFNGIQKSIVLINSSISKINLNNLVSNIIGSGLDIADFFAGPFAQVFISTKRIIQVFFDGIDVGLKIIQSALGSFAGVASDIASVFGVDGEIVKSLKDFKSFTDEEFLQSVNSANDSIKSLGEPIDTTLVQESIAIIRDSVIQAQESIGDGAIIPGIGANSEQEQSKIETLSDKFRGLGAAIKETAIQFRVSTQDIARSLISGIGNAAGAAFSAFGKALVEGDNALKAFGRAFAASIGQAAVQLGTRFILEGIAISFNPLLGGPAVGGPLIGAGAALATFGGALGAVAGGGAASGGGGVASPTIGPAPVNDNPIIDQQIERQEPETRVAVNIQGDVLDSDESGIRIVNILNQAFDQQGVVIRRGVIA